MVDPQNPVPETDPVVMNAKVRAALAHKRVELKRLMNELLRLRIEDGISEIADAIRGEE